MALCWSLQSCTACQYLSELISKALVDPSTSRQAALFHQLKALLQNDVITNAASGPTVQTVKETLSEQSVVGSMFCPFYLVPTVSEIAVLVTTCKAEKSDVRCV